MLVGLIEKKSSKASTPLSIKKKIHLTIGIPQALPFTIAIHQPFQRHLKQMCISAQEQKYVGKNNSKSPQRNYLHLDFEIHNVTILLNEWQ